MALSIVSGRRCLDLTGKRLGKLTVLRIDENKPRPGEIFWICQCDCGNEKSMRSSLLASNHSRSCGCGVRNATIARNFKHGKTDTPEHIIWKAMKQRCYYTKGKQYKDYGGRGIKVCERWLHSFENFLADMGPKPSPKHTIERKNTNGDYGPENCCWATRKEQGRNKRNNINLTFNGETHNTNDWAKITGISGAVIRKRIKGGWTVEQALTIPPSLHNSVKKCGTKKKRRLPPP